MNAAEAIYRWLADHGVAQREPRRWIEPGKY
jgi:hypothetical protein